MTKRPLNCLLIGLSILSVPTLTLAAPSETVIYRNRDGNLGSEIGYSGVALSKAGVVYGFKDDATFSEVFKLVKPKQSSRQMWRFDQVFRFSQSNGPRFPVGQPFFDGQDSLYGLALAGGAHNSGAIFQLRENAPGSGVWEESDLYDFPHHDDLTGYVEQASLIPGIGGTLYGTTFSPDTSIEGICTTQCGTVFSLTPPAAGATAWVYKTIYTFQGGADGDNPASPLVQAANGVLYGTTRWGGSDTTGCYSGRGCGTIFQLQPPSQGSGTWTKTILYTYPTVQAGTGDGAEGGEPVGALTLDRTGALYGTTAYEGAGCYPSGSGVAFEALPPSGGQGTWSYSVIHTFSCSVDGISPNGGLLPDGKGSLLGTTFTGGTNGGGAVFKLVAPTPKNSNWKLVVLYSFPSAPADASVPDSSLIWGKSGQFFGTSLSGGSRSGDGHGTVFEITP